MNVRTIKPPLPLSGDVFEIPHPFVRETYEAGFCWRPGTVDGPVCEVMTFGKLRTERRERVAHGMGVQILTALGTFRPGKFPTRVFYTRRWRDPNGREFGKVECRIASLAKWRRLVRGYNGEFEMEALRESLSAAS